jgi:hypothetical protein
MPINVDQCPLFFRCSARQLDMRRKRRNSGMSSSNESKSPEDAELVPVL